MFCIRGVTLLDEKRNQCRHVFLALGQTRHTNLDGTQAIEEVFTKSPRGHFAAQITVRSRDQPHIHSTHLGRSDPLDFAVLDHPQKFGLHGDRGLADFVKKHRATIGILEKAGSCLGSARKSATNMTE